MTSKTPLRQHRIPEEPLLDYYDEGFMIDSSLSTGRQGVINRGSSDPRFDLVPFRYRPMYEISKRNFACVDPAFLLEKMYSGGFWLISDKLSRDKREDLFQGVGQAL